MKKNRDLIDKRQFIRHYMEPFLVRPPEDNEDPRPNIMELLKHGKGSEVIAKYDPMQSGAPPDQRTYNFLVHAHLQVGSTKRAGEIAKQAIRRFRLLKDAAFEATAWAVLARVLWRTKGLMAALKALNRALTIDPNCKTAIINRLCYASLERNDDLIREFLKDFRVRVPEYWRDEFYRFYLLEDAQLEYLRSIKDFRPILKNLKSKKENKS